MRDFYQESSEEYFPADKKVENKSDGSAAVVNTILLISQVENINRDELFRILDPRSKKAEHKLTKQGLALLLKFFNVDSDSSSRVPNMRDLFSLRFMRAMPSYCEK